MKPWEVVGRTRMPDGADLTLTHHDGEYALQVGGQNLMSSRAHGSEVALAIIGCRRARSLATPRVLVGGLGMGFTLRAALDRLPPTAEVIVSELVPDVVVWNRGPLGALTRHPLDDPRVRVDEGDVAAALRSHPRTFDAVLLDVDNGPAALISPSNSALYDARGVAAARASLRRGGVLAIWLAQDDPAFERLLRRASFTVEREHVTSAAKGRGSRHTILVASLA